ncbi:MAG: ubiquinol-cytochrome C chaperone family protein [Micavibrio sp.]
MFFKWARTRAHRKRAAAQLYQTALAQSREPVFYRDYGVADTMDGRFDMLGFHAALIMEGLRPYGREGRALAQALFDKLFREVEFALRESGVGDLGVPKHMGRMMRAFNGRAHAYHEALAGRDVEALEKALARNIYRDDTATEQAGALAKYGFEAMIRLEPVLAALFAKGAPGQAAQENAQEQEKEKRYG